MNTEDKYTIKPEVEHLEDASDVSSKEGVTRDELVFEEAKQAAILEKDMTLKEGLKYYKKSIFWAMVLSATIIMEGYDTSLIGSFYAYPSFQKKYGEPINDQGDYELSAKWQTALKVAGNCGTLLGVLANGYLIEKFGHRKVIMTALVVLSGFIFIPVFAPSVGVLVAGQVLNGLPWGIFATMGPTYASEVVPLALRGYLTAYVNMCWAIGQFISAGVLQGLVGNKTRWGYRIPFAVQWAWPIPLFILTFLAPDSPWWLVRSGKHAKAERSLKRLCSKGLHHQIPSTLALMVHTNALEQAQQKAKSEEEKGFKGYLQCFQGTNLRRTEIVCVTFAGQILSGSSFAYSPSYFFSQAGLASDQVYKLNLGVTAIAFSGCIFSWFLLNKFGRRTIYVTGYGVLTSMLLLIGVLASPAQSSGIRWAQAGITLVWVATYASTIGPLAFTIVSEMGATRLRAQTVALARTAYNFVSLISGIVEPYLINPSAANLKGKTGYFWFGTALPTFIWAFFRLPESRGRTYEELDILFDRRISARKFSSTNVDLVAVEIAGETS